MFFFSVRTFIMRVMHLYNDFFKVHHWHSAIYLLIYLDPKCTGNVDQT